MGRARTRALAVAGFGSGRSLLRNHARGFPEREFGETADTRAGGRGSGLVARLFTAVSRCPAVPSPRLADARSTRPGNLSRAVAQPAPLRCALTSLVSPPAAALSGTSTR